MAAGVACSSKSELLKRRDGGAGMTGGAGTGGELVPDGGTGATPDGSTDGGYHWAALPALVGAPMTTIASDSQGALYAAARTTLSGLVTNPHGRTGIFRSGDEGASWRSAGSGFASYDAINNPGLQNYDFRALATVGTTVYAGGHDLLRSTDGGASWQRVASDYFDEGFTMIAGSGDVVAAVNVAHLWLSTDAGNTFQMTTLLNDVLSLDVLGGGAVILLSTTAGVYRSTDAGATFKTVHESSNGPSLYGWVRCDGQRTCYVAAYDIAKADDPHRLLTSTDAGATWTPLTSIDSDKVLAISDTGGVYVGTAGTAKIRRSDDGGATFTEIMGPATGGWVEPNCDGPLVARGDKVFLACPDGVYRSDDKGQSWRPASGSRATGAITGCAAQIFVDKSPTALGPDGDIYVVGVQGLTPGPSDNQALLRSSDGGWTWQTVSPAFSSDQCIVTPGGALECTNVITAATRSFNARTVARSDDHGATWREVPYASETVQYNPIGLATDGFSVYLAADLVSRSTDDGRTFQVIPNSPASIGVQALRNGHLLAAGINGGPGFRSDDHGATWQQRDFFKLPLIEDRAGRLIRSFSGSTFQVSTDDGLTWTAFESTGVANLGSVMPVPLAADGAGHLFVFAAEASSDVKNVGPLQVSMSDDGGASFVRMAAQIPNADPTSFATDKQGRLLVATLAGVFRLDSDGDPGSRPDGGMPGTPDGGAGGPTPRALSALTMNGPWLPKASGMAVDAAHRVYVADDSAVYAIDPAGASSPYLTRAEAASTAGLAGAQAIFDVEAGPDGKLYVLLSSGLLADATRTDTIVTSSAAHQATRLRDLSPVSQGRMAVIGAGRVGYYTLSDFWSATAAGTQNIYAAAALGWDTDYCVIGDVLIGGSGAVAFVPSCSWNPIQLGSVTGGPLATLYTPIGPNSLFSEHFGCGARDPAGGFTFVVTDFLGGHNPRLVHLPETATGPAVPVAVPTRPTLGEVSVGVGLGASLFNDCLMAIAADGVIYVQSANGIWKIAK
jgi:hypothetical protein